MLSIQGADLLILLTRYVSKHAKAGVLTSLGLFYLLMSRRSTPWRGR
jgi:hypothetical protein